MEGSKTTMQYLENLKRDGIAKTTAMKKLARKTAKRLTLASFLLGIILAGVVYAVIAVSRFYDENTIVVKSPVELEVRKNRVVTITPRVKEVVVSSEQEKVDEAIRESTKPEVAEIICNLWSAVDCKVAIATYTAESGLDPLAVNWNSRDFGVAQINLPTWEEKIAEKFGFTRADLLTAEKNLKVAYWIWDRADGVEGNERGSFDPWIAYINGDWLAKQ